MLPAIILSLGMASASASTSMEVSPTRPEDAWWQLTQRKERIYLVVGVFSGYANPASAPYSSLLGIHSGGTASFGYFVHPLVAVEAQGYFALENSSGFFGPPVRGSIGGVRAGARFALPIYITPIFAAHLGYARGHTEWDARSGDFWVKATSAGSNTADTLTGTVEGGVQFNFRHLTAEALWTTDFCLARSSRPSSPAPEPLSQMGLSLRIGARF